MGKKIRYKLLELLGDKKFYAGEILISEDSVKSGNLDVEGLECRSLEVKGIHQPVSVRVVKV